MKTIRLLLLSALALLALSAAAGASEFDSWTVKQITSHPDFVRDSQPMSGARNSGDADADKVYHWIGYIPVDGKRVYFTSFGEPLTCIEWQQTGEWVPEWVAENLDRLVEAGYIKLNGDAAEDEAETTITVEGRG